MESTYDRVRDDVRAQFATDPRLPYPDEIAVELEGGTVVLRGTVGSVAQQQAAVADARRTPGVEEVIDELEVRLLVEDRRKDAEIRGAALQRLVSGSELSDLYLDVAVKHGWLTLKGEADHQYQSDAAFDRVATLRGITGVTNEIKVIERRRP
jgi:osmotically-inducible protein OsmY